MIVIASISWILIVIIIGVVSFLFEDEAPNSRVPWALCNIKIEFIRVYKIIFIASFIATGLSDGYTMIALLILILADVLVIYLEIFTISYLNYSIQVIDILSFSFTGIYSIFLCISYVKIQIIIDYFKYFGIT